MAHINSIGAGIYSDLSVSVPSTPTNFSSFTYSEADFKQLFSGTEISPTGTPGTDTFIRIRNIREFPAMGTPPNVVNVPVYGSATSQQIQGQADAPSMELTLNFVPSDWAKATELGKMVGNGRQYVFRFVLLNSRPPGYQQSTSGGIAGTTGTTGEVRNTQYYWVGKLEALQVTPQLTDANTATITITIQSDFYGAFTTDPA
jgi:hypothetical protein